jgi:2,3-diketo-5-methylthiopentyl-1-phosphate enolase
MSSYQKEIFVSPESINRDENIIGTYIVSAETDDVLKFAARLALEASTGSWTPLPLETRELLEKHGAKITKVFEVPDFEDKILPGKRTFVLEFASPVINIGYQIPMLMTIMIGVISFFGDVKLVELELPASFTQHFPGPRFGIQGIRDYLGIAESPLLCGIIKPPAGLTPSQSADLFYQMAVGGADMVKDDEKIANAPYSSIAERVKAVMEAEKRVYEETGRRTYYAVNITDVPEKVMDNAKVVVDAGGNMLMLSHLTTGMNVIQTLAESPDVNLPIMIHPDFLGGFSRSHRLGMSSHLALGKLPRLCGADVSAYVTAYGSVQIVKEKYIRLARSLQSKLHAIQASWIQVGGALHPGTVPAVISDLGKDVILGAGGAVHAHPMGSQAGARAIRQAIDAVVVNRSIEDAAEEYEELRVAIHSWGVVGKE